MKFQFIRIHRNENRISKMCEMFGVTPGGYYQWKNRGKSKRELENEYLLHKIREVYKKSNRIYGSPRITEKLREQSISCSKHRVARIMRENGIISRTVRKFKATTNSNHNLPIAPNLVNQDFGVEVPNRLWVGDITYIDTDEGWLYLAKVMDVYNREIIGWAADKRMKKELVIKAMERSLMKRKSYKDLIFHSDRGSQYASHDFRRQLRKNGIRQSMSNKGNCYDNAIAESFFKTLKTELIYHKRYKTREEAKLDLFEYIEVFYNRERLHSALDYKTPIEYRKYQHVA